jgi:SAM-dependent methyltransferase
MMEKIYRYWDAADYALCRLRFLHFPTWNDFQSGNLRRLYAGKLRRGLPQFATHMGITPYYASTRNIRHDVAEPFPIPNGSVELFQSEDVFEHIELSKIVPIFNEIHRILKSGGLFRLSLPDYRLDHNIRRSVKDPDGHIVFDPGGGGDYVDGRVTGGGHLWFPTIEIVRTLFEESLFNGHGVVKFLHYNNGDGAYQADPIDYNLGHKQRTPDHDNRLTDPRQPISIVVDAFKS